MKKGFLAIILALLLSGPVSAALVDFRDSGAFGAANYQPSFSTGINGYTVMLTALPNGARLYQDSTDGLGVRYSYEADEIEGIERLAIGFSTPVRLSSLLITDLFNEGYLERGSYQLNGTGSWITFQALTSQVPGSTNGELTVLFAPNTVASSIAFRSPGYLASLNQRHEFSVAAIEASAVPIPAAAWLLGTGVVGLAVVRRRRIGTR
jgi:hypothetical protein